MKARCSPRPLRQLVLSISSLLPLLLGVFTSASAYALNPGQSLGQFTHDVWTSRDGLPEGPVLSILESTQGDLWLGTQGALVRFDGVEFTSFEPGRANLPQFSFARSLVEDENGVLWAGLVGGVASYKEGRFEFFSEAAGLKHPFVYSLAADASGKLYVGTGGSGLWLLESGRFTPFVDDELGKMSSQINSLLQTSNGQLAVGSDSGLALLGDGSRSYSTSEGLPSPVINALCEGAGGELWLGTNGGLARLFAGELISFTQSEGLSDNHVTALHCDSRGTLWIGMQDGGIQRLLDDDESFSLVDSSRYRGSIRSIYEDSGSSLWIGTDKGLERFLGGPFHAIGAPQGLEEEDVLAIHSKSDGGLWLLDASGALSSLQGEELTAHLPPGSIQGEGMLGLAETDDGSLWIAGSRLTRYFEGKLFEFERAGGDFTVLLSEGSSLLAAQTERDGKSVISRFEGGSFSAIEIEAPLTHIQRLKRDSRGRLWISTGGSGLVRYDGSRTHSFTKKNGLPHDVVYGLVEDKLGAMWVATRGGLARIQNEVVSSFAQVPDAPIRSPLHLHLDQKERLWVTADDAIYLLSLKRLRDVAEGRHNKIYPRTFSERKGLPSGTISWRSAGQAITQAGQLSYATNNGLLAVEANRIEALDTKPAISLGDVIVDGQMQESSRALALESGDKRLEFHFGAPNLGEGDLSFRHRLRGYDNSWTEAGQKRVAHYTGVSGGKYVFEAEVYRRSNPELRGKASTSLSVAPHLLQRWSVRGVLIALSAFGLWGLYFLRVRHLKRRQSWLKERVAEGTESLRIEVRERGAAEAEVRELNALLEGRVASRTGQLTATNRELSHEKNRHSATLNSLIEGVVTTDQKGKITLTNPVAEAMLERPASELVGRNIAEVVVLSERYRPRSLTDPVTSLLKEEAQRQEESSAGRSGEAIEALLMSPSGRARLVDVSAAVINNEEDALEGAVLVFRDITERAKVQERIQESEKLEAVGLLAGGIAHDFNNLLTGIFGYVQLSQRKLPQDSQEYEWLRRATSVLSDARGLSGQLLTFASGGSPALRTHSILELVRQSVRFVLAGSGVETKLDLSDSTWKCQLDPLQLRRALDNLLLNARQAMEEKGSLTISSRNLRLEEANREGLSSGPYVELTIADTGPGMDEETQKHAFEPFFTTRAKGSGLGLASVQSIVSRHHGSIELNSVMGKGSTFRLLLQAVVEAPSIPPVSPEVRISLKPDSPRRILVMDDEETIRDLAQMALSDAGYQVTAVSEGGEAISEFVRAREAGKGFHLVVLDLTIIGGMGGYETLKELRALDQQIPIISSSGYVASLPPGTEGLRFDAALPKPYMFEELVEIVERWHDKS